jgi:hypothetical protein
MCRIGKPGHIRPGLGDDRLRHHDVHAGNGIQSADQVAVIAHLLIELPIDARQFPIQPVEFLQQPIEHPFEMRVGSAFQSRS